jgi:hypothetical protein
MPNNHTQRLSRLEHEERHREGGGVVVIDRRFSMARGERTGIEPALTVRIEDPWAWDKSEGTGR